MFHVLGGEGPCYTMFALYAGNQYTYSNVDWV